LNSAAGAVLKLAGAGWMRLLIDMNKSNPFAQVEEANFPEAWYVSSHSCLNHICAHIYIFFFL
jgi:hypothetical protein